MEDFDHQPKIPFDKCSKCVHTTTKYVCIYEWDKRSHYFYRIINNLSETQEFFRKILLIHSLFLRLNKQTNHHTHTAVVYLPEKISRSI